MSTGEGQQPLSRPLVSLVVANLATIILALLQDWDVGTVIFIYWFQSVVIGIFTIAQILTFPAAGVRASGGSRLWGGGLLPDLARIALPGPGVWLVRLVLAGFFAFHYGFFHWIYLIFLAAFGFLQTVNFGDPDLILACGIFVINHLYSFIFYRGKEPGELTGLKEVITQPYQRILPMHLTIMLAGFASFAIPFTSGWYNQLVLVFFLGVKTYADVKGHVEKHRAGMKREN